MYEPTFFDQVMSVNTPIQNRNDNYFENIKPNLTKKESVVLNTCVQINKPSTMHEVAKFLGVELNTISGRFSKLCEKGELEITGKTTNRRSIYEVVK